VRGRTDHLPLAPFLGAGAVFAILAGGPVLRLWLG
jgi:prepilin signal peptidase PulO-like enzyme (type II secretory pathway)